MAIKSTEVELTEEIRAVCGVEGCEGLRLLVRYRGTPLGWVYMPCSGEKFISPRRLQEAIREQTGWQLIPGVFEERVVPRVRREVPSPPISVIVCTRNRAGQLQTCLESLVAQDYPDYEIIVVDNASKDDLTARLTRQMGVRCVGEARPGLNWARNRGIAEARHDIIAFTDDDTRADRLWLKAIAGAFARSEVMAVTGLIAAMELETTAQIYFELVYGGMGKGCKRWLIRKSTLQKKHLLWSSTFGAGANMAFRRELFEKVGLFDVALDVGTASRGGGDLEFFHRVVARGFTMLYEPAALVWHRHRRDFASLRRQVYDNGCGFGAYLLTCWHNRTIARRKLLRFALREWLGSWLLHRLWRPKKHLRRLVWAELSGALHSPWAYRQAQKQAEKLAGDISDEASADSRIDLPSLAGEYTTLIRRVGIEHGGME